MTLDDRNSTILQNNDQWRLIIGNINSFPGSEGGMNKYKLKHFKKLVTGKESDIIILSEHNKNLSKINHHNKPSEMIKK